MGVMVANHSQPEVVILIHGTGASEAGVENPKWWSRNPISPRPCANILGRNLTSARVPTARRSNGRARIGDGPQACRSQPARQVGKSRTRPAHLSLDWPQPWRIGHLALAYLAGSETRRRVEGTEELDDGWYAVSRVRADLVRNNDAGCRFPGWRLRGVSAHPNGAGMERALDHLARQQRVGHCGGGRSVRRLAGLRVAARLCVSALALCLDPIFQTTEVRANSGGASWVGAWLALWHGEDEPSVVLSPR